MVAGSHLKDLDAKSFGWEMEGFPMDDVPSELLPSPKPPPLPPPLPLPPPPPQIPPAAPKPRFAAAVERVSSKPLANLTSWEFAWELAGFPEDMASDEGLEE